MSRFLSHLQHRGLALGSLLQSFACIWRILAVLTGSLRHLFGSILEVFRLWRMCCSSLWNFFLHPLGCFFVNHNEGLLTELHSHVHRCPCREAVHVSCSAAVSFLLPQEQPTGLYKKGEFKITLDSFILGAQWTTVFTH